MPCNYLVSSQNAIGQIRCYQHVSKDCVNSHCLRNSRLLELDLDGTSDTAPG